MVITKIIQCYFHFSKLFHVRPVTQGDVYRAETEEIPKIFQVTSSLTVVYQL